MSTRRESNDKGKESREQILLATIDLFCERGFSGTSVNAVCAEVGIAKTALYWHFGSKDGLLAAVIERVADSWMDEIQADVFQAGTPEQRLSKLVDGLRDIVDNRPHLLRLLFIVILESANVDATVRDTVIRIRLRTIETISRGFQETLGLELPDMDLLVHTILSLVEGALRQSILLPETCDLDRLFVDLRRTIDLLISDRLSRLVSSPPG